MAILEDSDVLLFSIQISAGILFLLILVALVCYCKRRVDTSAAAGGPRAGNGASDEISSGSVVKLGYDDVTLSKFPELLFSKAKSGGDCGGCSICLTDFREKERLRLLPRCGHVFHVTCVDEWLRRQITCPICRKSAFLIPLALLFNSEGNSVNSS